MRLLHTADWHLGKVLKGVDRTPEIWEGLEALLEVVRKDRVDLLVVAGDLLDRPQVPGEVEKLLIEFFLRLEELRVPALVIAGNHDPKERLQALSPLLARFGVRVLGELRLRGEGGVVDLGGLEVGLLPFLSERVLVRRLALEGEKRHQTYAEAMRRLLDNLKSPLMVGHFALEGARPGGGEFAFHLGGNYVVPRAALPLEARYLALGHLHRQQQASEAPLAWYPGSLVQLDFGEGEGAERGFLLVELEEGVPPKVHPIRQSFGKPLRTYRLTPEELDRRHEELAHFPGYLRLVVEGRLPPTLKERLFREWPHLLALETPASPLAPPALGDGLDLVALYGKYLEAQGVDQGEGKALTQLLARLWQEVEDAALSPGA